MEESTGKNWEELTQRKQVREGGREEGRNRGKEERKKGKNFLHLSFPTLLLELTNFEVSQKVSHTIHDEHVHVHVQCTMCMTVHVC